MSLPSLRFKSDSPKKPTPRCPRAECPSQKRGPKLGHVIRYGTFKRKADGSRPRRFRCKPCGRSFSSATSQPEFGQRKRSVNRAVHRTLSSCVSQRRCARLLTLNRKTVAKKAKFLAEQFELAHRAWLQGWVKDGLAPVEAVQMDEMETFEHSKWRPLSIGLLVEPKSRKILSFTVSSMPAKGLLAPQARRKYGQRKDDRLKGLKLLLQEAKGCLSEGRLEIRSDSHPFYPGVIREILPHARHLRELGRKSSLGGQGELKKIGFDPLFALNHTAAMIRANLSRMVRKTWCKTKKLEGLRDHLWLYVNYHNTVLT